VCDAAGKEATDSARSLGNVATIVFGVGAAMAVGGGILWLTAPRAPTSGTTAMGAHATSATSAATVRVRVAPQAVLLEGTF